MNALKSILVQMDASSRSAVRLQIAARLARQHDASVTALYPAGRARLHEHALVLGDDAGTAGDRRLAQLSAARRMFDRAVANGLDCASFEALSGDPVRSFARQALAADMMVLGQRDPDGGHGDLPDDFVESVLLSSGRPALVVPYVGEIAPLDEVALIAWKPCRESARAVSAALPLLRRAERVYVATWSDAASDAASQAPVDIVDYLRVQGVDASVRAHGPATRALGDQLLSVCADLGVGLLVMGCYGTSVTKEWALGGATRTVLQSMTMPVLMAH